ncbi:DUF4190 domain-containing protein [Nocardiopsis sp. YSL2]|uniref:DUF4190 domain-containing protein n=1 Tax=Nocardiopsis sp. YSL2 TaxID=2939492 RepID=UPI0026F4192C|nr:DUF4190 domain-containing protein [Nocardiopsis sp. YSL2]
MNQQPPYNGGTPPTGYPPEGYYQPVTPAETSGLATVSLVVGIASVTPLGLLVFPPIVGAVTGVLALVRIRGSAGHLKGTTMALWGIVLSGFSLFVLVVAGVFVLSAESEPAGQTVAVGEAGSTGDWEVTVVDIQTRTSYTDEFDLTEYPQGEFQVIQMEVSNQGTEATVFDASEAVTLHDSEGNAHSVDFTLLGDFVYTDINPGNSLSGEVVVDVPEGTEVSELEVVDPSTLDDPLTVTVN